MNSSKKLLLALVIVALGGMKLAAQITQDGSTVDDLVKITNADGSNGAEASLFTDAQGTNKVIRAEQVEEGFPFYAARNAWYSSQFTLTSGVYTVSADFLPAAVSGENRGGVIGWLNTSSKTGISLQVRPAGFSPAFQVAVINFQANNASDNETLAGLYNLDGTPATDSTGSAVSDLGTYDPSAFARFKIEFTAPTTADKQALTNVTAHLKATILQGGTNQIGSTMELLTDLPLPAAAAHRAGYFAYWGAIADVGVIGYLDNLIASGAVSSIQNNVPTVALTSPTNNASFIAPSDVALSATAADSDGSVKRVEYYANDVLVGSATTSPYNATWQATTAGNYRITARAIDDLGGSAISSGVVNVTIKTNEPPTVSLTSPANGAVLSVTQNLDFTAEASDADGQIERVEFFVDGVSQGFAFDAPYTAIWFSPTVGQHVLTVSAVDERGAIGTNATPVTVTVVSGQPPTVGIINPANNAEFQAGADVNFQIHAAQQGGKLTNVTLTVGATVVASATASANDTLDTTLIWKSATEGTYSVTASVTDNTGLTANSIPVNVIIKPATSGPGPKLSIAQTGNSVVISWPSAQTGYRLQATTSLTTPAWADVASANNSATVNTAGTTRFFRLVKP